jgi:hypothetical protein
LVATPALAQNRSEWKRDRVTELLSPTGLAAYEKIRGIGIFVVPDESEVKPILETRPDETFPEGTSGPGGGPNRNFRNVFVNDPCLDPPPEAPFPINFLRTVQSETEIAVLNKVSGHEDDEDDDNEDDDKEGNGGGRLMVAGYNDSYGFDDNRQGLSGFSYSTNGGKLWIDASGLPPAVNTGLPAGTPGQDAYFGDPVVVVHHKTKLFYYASLYQTPQGFATISVNRGRFKVAPQQVPIESQANTRCQGHPALHGIPDPPPFYQERIIWDPPVAAVLPPFLDHANDAFLDKEWLYVDQKTGVLYLTYTRFSVDGSTPIELVRSFDQGQTWTPPSVIVPNLLDQFNQATMPVVTPTGRVIVTWHARVFPAPTFIENAQRIESAYSDNCLTPAPCTFSVPVTVSNVNPQGEPPGYNRARPTILNAPYINVDLGRDDGVYTKSERKKKGFGNVYITYFSGKTPFNPVPPQPIFTLPGNRAGDIFLSTSPNNGTTYQARVKVNDDHTVTSHVFPSVQVNKKGLVFVTWLDRRVDPHRNLLTDTYGDISSNQGRSFGRDVRLSDVSTDWITREDAQPDFGDYNSSTVINFTEFASIWADGRFPTPAPLTCNPSGVCTRPANRAATPDSIFEIFGDGRGDDDKGKGDGDDD